MGPDIVEAGVDCADVLYYGSPEGQLVCAVEVVNLVAPGQQSVDDGPTSSHKVSEVDNAPVIKPSAPGGETAGKRFPQSVRNQADVEDPTHTCVYCGKTAGEDAQLDHAIPRSKGGDATLENAQWACGHCNASKGNGDYPKTPPSDYQGPWPRGRWGNAMAE